jgi:hypothetical protein
MALVRRSGQGVRIMAARTWIAVACIVLSLVVFTLQPNTVSRKQTIMGVVGLILGAGGVLILLVGVWWQRLEPFRTRL